MRNMTFFSKTALVLRCFWDTFRYQMRIFGYRNQCGSVRSLKQKWILYAACIFMVSSIEYAVGDVQENHDLFMDPPRIARTKAYWDWLNGNVNRQQLSRDLKEAKSKGMGGLEIWDVGVLRNSSQVPAGPAFLSPESVQNIKYALKEGKRLDMKIGMVASSGWNAGGSWVTPDWASKNLFYSTFTIKGPRHLTSPLPFPKVPEQCPKGEDGRPLFSLEVAVLAVPKTVDNTITGIHEVINLTDNFEDGQLVWDVPAGKWKILRFVCSNSGQSLIACSPNSKGLFIDFLEPSATKHHLKYILDKLEITPENADQSGLSYLEVDSMELHSGIAWTDRFPEYFTEWRGYDPIPYLPVLAGWKIQGKSEAFLYDYKKTVSDQLILSHYTTGSNFLNKYGIDMVAEAGGPGPPIWNSCPVDAIKALGNVNIPRGEFWIKHRNIFLVKEIASAAHIYGKKIVDAESFTTWRRWQDGPFDLKKLADRAFCEGLNHLTIHTFAHTPPEAGSPGWAYHAGVDFNPKVTWWSRSKPFVDYLSRCCYMLQKGHFVADICYYYGDQAPNFWPAYHDVPTKPQLTGLDAGYDYDVVNTDVILNRMSVKDGRIVLPDGMSYKTLMLPSQVCITAEVLAKIESLVKAGAILIVDSKPEYDPRLDQQPQRSNQVRELTETLWPTDSPGIRSYGHGKVISGMSATESLKQCHILKDFSFSGEADLDFIHRSTPTEEIYFVRNIRDQACLVDCRFRVSGRPAELWDPATGKVKSLIPFETENNSTRIRLNLDANGSVFVVFPNQPPSVHPVSITSDSSHKANLRKMTEQDIPVLETTAPGHYTVAMSDGKHFQAQIETLPETQTLGGPWKVTFPKGWGAPESKIFDTLKSWTEFSEEGIKYFSGTAAYHRVLNICQENMKPGLRFYLDLGTVKDLAEVYVNSQPQGIVWKAPFRVDITDAIKVGKNNLKIEVVNLWINRLAGDMKLPKEKRYCSTNVLPISDNEGALNDPQLAGLLGPVRLIPSICITMQED